MDVITWLLLAVLIVLGFVVERRIAGVNRRLLNLHVMHERELYAICTRLDKVDELPRCSPFPEPPPDPEVAEILRDRPIAPPVHSGRGNRTKKPAQIR